MGRRITGRSSTFLQARQILIEVSIALRARGKTWREIAEELNWPGKNPTSSAATAVSQALRKRAAVAKDMVEEHRQHLLAQLDEAEKVIWEIIRSRHLTVSHGKIITMRDEESGEVIYLKDSSPNMQAIDRLIRIQERRAKLSGLDAPTKQEVGMDVQYTVNGVDISQLK